MTSPRRIVIVGGVAGGASAANVFTLRDLHDADGLHAAVAAGARRAVVVGAGYIGLELAEMLARRGLGVTLVERLPQVLQALDPELASIVSDELRRRGICVRLGQGLAGFALERGLVRAVTLDDGGEIEADLVVLALGVRPELRLAKDAGLAIGPAGGIRVDEYMRTSAAGIYAVGDAVEYIHAVTARPALVPLAGPATRAGRVAGEHAATDAAARPSPPDSRSASCWCPATTMRRTIPARRRWCSRSSITRRTAGCSGPRWWGATGWTSGSSCWPPPSAWAPGRTSSRHSISPTLRLSAPPAIRSMWRASWPRMSGAGSTGFSRRGSS